jgi:hypothetical protein
MGTTSGHQFWASNGGKAPGGGSQDVGKSFYINGLMAA